MSEWIKWNGGENPIPGKACVIRLDNGLETHPELSDGWEWKHYDNGGDIIAYRVIEEEMHENCRCTIVDNYAALRKILDDAFDQSANGKGKERHANDLPWREQPIIAISRLVGDGGVAFQAIKKITEAQGMAKRGEHEAAYRECLGAIVYAAALAKLVKESK